MSVAITDRERVIPTAPERSLRQCHEALERANYIRRTRSAIKQDLRRDVAAGRLRVMRLLLEPPEEILTMKVFDLLLATPKWGRVRVNKALAQAKISPSKMIGGMSERQRRELVHRMGRGA